MSSNDTFALATRGYAIGTAASMTLYVLSIIVISWGGLDLQGPLLWLGALVPGACIAAQLWVTLRMMRQADEFVRALMAKRFIVAATLAFIVATTWGFLETYVRLAHMPGFLVYPAFWAAFGLVTPFIRTSH
ncbi:hypothetical protein [Azospirillum sp. B4]|uniref:hypothetical protein n=1 Tax=Azospirillum sp. B4 TaxID=95605 RepID=UPI00034621ED|nr:hypothetical protein [Azospirillum sp. B4]